MCELKKNIIRGIDLAGKVENPTGLATWQGGLVKTNLVHSDNEILEIITTNHPILTAIDAGETTKKRKP